MLPECRFWGFAQVSSICSLSGLRPSENPPQGAREQVTCHSEFISESHKSAFTLAEVLITLGIIGIVAAMTLPTLINKYQEKQFKTGYKKAYSELSQALQEGIYNQDFIRQEKYSNDATANEMGLLKAKFKVIKDCARPKDISVCWKKGDTLCGGACSSGNSDDGLDMDNGAPGNSCDCFTDVSGRNWCSYSATENIILVDINGFNNPNQFGKDRWIFTFSDANNSRASHFSNYKKIKPYFTYDITTVDSFCKRPPCYYKSWFLE